ncbi:MAG TPA: DNA polymerase I [Smithellaceae bacterium]|jgi:DNA polymerase-1|nr:DNA polymerase I [Smithellaceae bacterium]HNY96366.1 DNA polymerase I [Smithellaceae bacterium]HOH57140.1 DNA polymerase I [Smithellaceae bacterium]HPV71961.1 DNA polymerase I [Smithellaceae bacterium]HPY07142.1 DNA polymerase I [Smithellaceae bacterium]
MTEKNPNSLLAVVDGSNYLYRAFYGIPALSNSRGFPTNAIYGFTIMLMKLLKDIHPDYIVVTFDLKGPTARHEAYEDYKATRKPMPEDLIAQVPLIKEVIRGFSIPILEKQGTEADDLIGTLVVRARKKGWRAVIISGDKDLMQLIGDGVTLVDTMKDKTYDSAAVREKFGVGPDKVVEILGLMGDASDNIPGVPGIGPKTARRLIEEYGSVEAVLENAEKLHNVKLRESFRKYADQARLSRRLAVISTDVDLDFDLKDAARREPDREALSRLFRDFEFSSLLQQISAGPAKPEVPCKIVADTKALAELVGALRGVRTFACEMFPEKNTPQALIGMAIGAGRERFYIPLGHDGAGQQLKTEEVWPALMPFWANPKITKYAYDLKTALVLLPDLPVSAGMDLQLAAYLLNPARHSYTLDEVAWEYLQERVPSMAEAAGGRGKNQSLAPAPVDQAALSAGQRVAALLSLAEKLLAGLDQAGASSLYRDVEMPLLFTLAGMEKKGVLVDAALLKQMSGELSQLLALSEEKIYRLAGETFNINSPKQLQMILFEKMQLPKGKKTKEGYSTDVDVLSDLARSHELPAEILAYRSLAKLKSTYVDALPALISPQTGRIHTSYNQTVAATGRLSSSNPNLQNIPVRTVEGKRIRQAFIAPPGCVLISADYSQIELRVLAHLSEDEALLDAFAADADIHTRTASDVFGVFPEMVSPDMRRQAKVINFGILYGMSAFGLARELGVSQKTAQVYIDGYFARYKKVRAYLDGVLEGARRDGFVCTILNRRRWLPDLQSKIPSVRQFAERMAINAPIQGSAADLIKVAMVNIDRLLKEKNLDARLIMQVHDELVLEAPVQEQEDVKKLVREEMENVIRLKVPLKVEIASGVNWDEAH